MCIRDSGGDWQPNQTRKFRIPVRGGKDLQDGAAEFEFTFFVGKQRDRNLLTRLECKGCLLYTSDAADERSSVDLGGRRIIKKKKNTTQVECSTTE